MVLAPRRAPLADFVQRAARPPVTPAAEPTADAGLADVASVDAEHADYGFALAADLVVGGEVWDIAPGL
jgi:hypothetical protein